MAKIFAGEKFGRSIVMSQQYSIEQITLNLDKIIQEVAAGEAIEITQQDKQVAVIISTAEYARLLNKAQSFWESIERFRQDYDVETAEIDPDEIFTLNSKKAHTEQ
jgi:PTS system cellobiose-specific IIB component